MSFKKQILKRYLWDDDIFYIISHHWWVYVKLILVYLFFLILWFILYYVVCKWWCFKWFRYFFWLYGVLLYIKFIIDFLDLYLDSVVLTKQGVNIFYWDGLLKYSNELIERSSVEWVYDEQEGLLDVLLNKGMIKIKKLDEEYVFDDVYNPVLQTSKIIEIKEKIIKENEKKEEENNEEEIDKFDLLVEALGEIIRDYYKKK